MRRAWAESLEQWAGPDPSPRQTSLMPPVIVPNHQGRQQGTPPQGVTRRFKEGPQASGQGCTTPGRHHAYESPRAALGGTREGLRGRAGPCAQAGGRMGAHRTHGMPTLT